VDFLTLGLWEIVGTPIEAAQGNTYELTAVYDDNERAESITSQRYQAAFDTTG
jgi:hypothetical protein